MRIAIGRFWTESSSFAPLLANRALFEAGALVEDDALLDVFATRPTEVRGFLDVLQAERVEIVPLVGAHSSCAGPLEEPFWRELREGFVARLRAAGPLDGVLLSLHGSTVSEEDDDLAGALLAATRAVVGPSTLIVATLDLHGNPTRRMLASADALVAYKTYPHHDFVERGRQAAELLLRAARGEGRPTMAAVAAPLRLGSLELLRELIARGLELEREPGVLCCSIMPTHSYLDAAEFAPLRAVVVTDNDATRARELAVELLWQAWEARDRDADAAPRLTPLPDAIHAALAMPPGPVVLADRFDAVTAGFPGDSVEVARALLELSVTAPACVIVTDPAYARAAAAAGPGATLTAPLGGSWGGALYGPLTVAARVRRVADGTLLPSQEPLPGHLAVSNSSMGLTAVVEFGPAITAVVTSVPVMSTEPTVYRSAGVEPRRQRIVLTKSMAQQRMHYPFASGFIDLDAPGWGQTAATRVWERRPTLATYPDAPLTDTDMRAALGLPAR